MSVEPLSRIFMTCAMVLALTACGGGGGGSGGSLVSPPDTGTDGGGSSTTGSISLSISGLVDENGDPDNVLSGNEFATLSASVTENGQAANLVVLFTTTVGRLVTESAQSIDGTAEVQITGNGTAGAATVTAKTTLSNGDEIEDSIVVQMVAGGPTLFVEDSGGNAVSAVELRAAETAVLVVRMEDWDGTLIEGAGITFALTGTGVTADIATGTTDVNGELQVTLTGTDDVSVATGELTISSLYNEFELEKIVTTNGLGVDDSLNNITVDTVDAGSDGVLAGNEKTMLVARVTEDGVPKNGISVTFAASPPGSLTFVNDNDSATTANNGTDDGVAMVQVIGTGVAGTAEITVAATLSNGIDVDNVDNPVILQTSSVKPTLTLVLRNASGVAVNSVGANQDLTLEATIVDYDGSALDADDAGVNVTFTDVNALTDDFSTTNVVTDFAVCPVNGIKANTDCAWVAFTSNATARVGTLQASAELNSISLATFELSEIEVTNTGINSGSPDQDSFSITRNSAAIDDTVAIEGDVFNGETVIIDVDLADFFNNPVPDGTLVTFRTELGDITPTCTTSNGSCNPAVTFTSGAPREPIDSEVSFRNLNDDNCPSAFVEETVTINSSGDGLTDYRVADVLGVTLAGSPTELVKNTAYAVTANGIDCLAAPCTNGASVDIAYKRLWLDELNDGTTAHVIATPGVGTEPFLDVTASPCLAASRETVERISGSINPSGTTSVGGSGTAFRSELAVGDKIKVSKEVRTITSVTSDTGLQVDVAFSDTANDTSPERIAAPGYKGGMGQPYGGRSSVLAYTLGEESFVDVNGNEEYDYGETFFDLPEVFMDKNEDGVMGDVDGDSAAVTSVGPYSDTGTGGNPAGEKRDKSAPACYGPKTIVGDPAGAGSSTESEEYCYQDGGEEEFFIDGDGDGIMDVGNGIYNGSRCLTPLQDADGDGNADDIVCTTDLVNISREVQILMSGSEAFIEFRTTSGGANGGGEIVQQIERLNPISVTIPSPTSWSAKSSTTLSVQKGADVDTLPLLAGNMEVELFEIQNVFTTGVTWTLSFDVTRTDGGANTGDVEVFASGTQLTFNTGVCGDFNGTETCTVSTGFTVASDGGLIVASAKDSDPLTAEINNFVITGTTTGLTRQYRITNGVTVTANNNTAGISQFDVGNTIDANTVFAGVSERKSGTTVPELSTSLSSLNLYFTDRYNGQLPDGTTVSVTSDPAAGCTVSSVGGSGSSVTVGSGGVTTMTTVELAAGTGSGSGPLTATVSTPKGEVTTKSIDCQL